MTKKNILQDLRKTAFAKKFPDSSDARSVSLSTYRCAPQQTKIGEILKQKVGFCVSPVLLTALTGLIIIAAIEVKAADQKSDLNYDTLPQVTVIASDDNKIDGYKSSSSTSSMRTNTPLLDTPQSVSVVTQDQIRDQNITKMEETARYVPGVNVQMGEGHRDQITIRGMTNGSNGTTSNFFIDGARDDAEYVRDFYNIDRIEFLKGSNAMAFGRGSPGGAVNRVSKMADGSKKHRLIVSGGSFEDRRAEADIGDRVGDNVAIRLNSMYQKSNSYRNHAEFERYGINPTMSFNLGANTDLQLGYEHFNDQRFLDRGIPSQNGAPYKTNHSSFFGNPNQNKADVELNSFYGTLTHDFSSTLQLKNRISYTNINKFYQNVTPGSISSSDNLSLSAYNARTDRDNFTNQTDVIKKFKTGAIDHQALMGAEITMQNSSKLKYDGVFGSTNSKSLLVPITSPISYDSVSYSSLNENKSSSTKVYAAYIQDQADLNEYLQLTAGLRVDRFEVDFKDKKNQKKLGRIDTMISPRAGLVLKPRKNLSLYTSYGVTYVPNAGDQLDSLSTKNNKNLKPEKIQNYEIGSKWDVTPRLNLSAALFQLNRSDTPASDPNGSGNLVLTGESRTQGIEIAATGKITDQWQVIGGYAFQDAIVTKATEKYSKNAKIALVPHNTFSLWNRYDVTENWATALGVISQSSQFAAADNSVRLKGFTRFDGAIYYHINPSYRLQLNVENIFNRDYIQTAHSNSNILPGSPRAFKVAITADF